MKLKIKELRDTYPYFDFLSFFGKRDRTATEELLDMDLSFCSKKGENGWRDYLFLNLHPSAKEAVFDRYFSEENVVYHFEFKSIKFQGVRRGMAVYSVCMPTLERVCFSIF